VCRRAYLGLKRGGVGLPELPKSRCNIIAKNPVDGLEGHTYMPLQQADAAFHEGLAFVSRLFLVGITDARNESNRERKRVGSLTLLV